MVKKGQYVQVHYTGKLADGTLFDSSEGRQPLEFQAGGGQVIPGFENAVMDMALNEEKTINLSAGDAYGPLRDDLKRDFPMSMVGEDKIEVGQSLYFRGPQGPIQGKVLEVGPENFTVDFNHPLAGKDLTFHIKLVGTSEQPTQASGCGCSCSPDSGCGSSCDSC